MPEESRQWTFRVSCPDVSEDEVVCVTGSSSVLGRWNPKSVLKLAKVQNPEDHNGQSIWTSTVDIPSGRDVLFRYCVCLFLPAKDGTMRTVVRRWETDIKARKIACHQASPQRESEHCDTFGVISGSCLVQYGWLIQETLVEFKLYENALQIWRRKHKNKDFYIKLTAVDVNKANQNMSFEIEEVSENSADALENNRQRRSWPIVNVASFQDDECVFKPQNQFGAIFRENDFISFQAQVFDITTVSFLVDIYARGNDCKASNLEPAEHIASCYILPNHLKSTEGHVQMSLLSRNLSPVGQFSCAYLIVKPLIGFECEMSTTFARHWKLDWKGLDIGHRGLGDSYTKAQHCSNIRENTIASLKDAAAHGADMVEFDVQISKDFVPVIYHDYELVTPVQRKSEETASMMLKMPLKNLTLEQLHNLKIHHVGELTGLKSFERVDPDHEPFPTLEKALNVIDPGIGFNIEIKWDMELMDGSREAHHPFEINFFVDVILTTVLEHAKDRKIFFSSFNPDICTMIRSKQNKYPVLFLSQGMSTKYDQYRDPRTWSIQNATKFAEMSEILGVNIIAEQILKEFDFVPKIHDKKLVVFCWTDDMNDKATLKRLKELGLDAIVYDRMDVNNSKVVKESVFLVEQRRDQELELQMSPSSRCSCSSRSDGEDGSLRPSPPKIRAQTSAMASLDINSTLSKDSLVMEHQTLASSEEGSLNNKHDLEEQTNKSVCTIPV